MWCQKFCRRSTLHCRERHPRSRGTVGATLCTEPGEPRVGSACPPPDAPPPPSPETLGHDLRMTWGIGGVPRPGSRPSAKPVLYLDIDGVLNCEAPRRPEECTEHAVGKVMLRFSGCLSCPM